ncbi:hypothetical protein C7974DRAFT_407407 [Boeremia exigua]|uniref:uncharacterized protein n=1 Tax=Boeremia exigua TaxID=749465 RepID=UPI001E8E6870|nr:uncharacterized protein C7974DRAFT_407407 [Boeremia exigua]KAH6643686.1 hypothetical protein C7974DRAFT_407407 [Boeremia exigua]
MLGHTLAHCVLLATGAAAQLQSFALDMGSVDGVSTSVLPAPLLTTTSEALNSIATASSTWLISTIPAPDSTVATNSSTTSTFDRTNTTCLPTTVIVITLSNPTPTPTPVVEAWRNEEAPNDHRQEGAGSPFDTAGSESITKWPNWFTAATFALVFYDILALGVFLWLWVFGYLWWFRWSARARGDARAWRRGPGHVEMARMEVGRHTVGRDENTTEWGEGCEAREAGGVGE